MTTNELNQINHTLKKEVNRLIKSSMTKHEEAVKQDAYQVLDILRGNLNSWIEELDENKISKAMFEFLVYQKKDELEMNALAKTELSGMEIEIFKYCLLKQIVDSTINLIWVKQFFNENRC
jgi:hypothetical protein